MCLRPSKIENVHGTFILKDSPAESRWNVPIKQRRCVVVYVRGLSFNVCVCWLNFLSCWAFGPRTYEFEIAVREQPKRTFLDAWRLQNVAESERAHKTASSAGVIALRYVALTDKCSGPGFRGRPQKIPHAYCRSLYICWYISSMLHYPLYNARDERASGLSKTMCCARRSITTLPSANTAESRWNWILPRNRSTVVASCLGAVY